MPNSEGVNSARQGFNQVQTLKMSAKGAMASDDMVSSGQKSTNQALDNLDINLDEGGAIGKQGEDLLVSEIRTDNQLSGRQDDMAEMEKLLNSGGAFGKKNLGDTFKKINNEIADDDYEEGDESLNQNQISMEQKSGLDEQSDMDMSLHDNSKLLMESPGQNTLVQNQINELTNLDH